MKTAARHLMRVTGAFTPFRLFNRNRALILMYHRFSARDTHDTISANAFRQHLEYLTAHYRVVALSQIGEFLNQRDPFPPGLAAITIDDGYRDAYDIALPLLQRFNVPATLFVVTDFIDHKRWLWTDILKFLLPRTTRRFVELALNHQQLRIELSDTPAKIRAATCLNAFLKTLPNNLKDSLLADLIIKLGVALPSEPTAEFQPLSWDKVRELDNAGVEIGSHTVTHPILTNIDQPQLQFELRQSKTVLEEKLNRTVELFCYPNGNYDKQVLAETAKAGYRQAVTTDEGLNEVSSAPLKLKRLAAESDLTRFIQITSGFEQVKSRIRNARRLAKPKSARQTAQTAEM
ncbi:MAG: polysaccharide deacetylase family protein [Acidobacteriota bacterium]